MMASFEAATAGCHLPVSIMRSSTVVLRANHILCSLSHWPPTGPLSASLSRRSDRPK